MSTKLGGIGQPKCHLWPVMRRLGLWRSLVQDVSGVKVGDHVVMSLLRSCGRCFFCSKGDTHLCEGKFALQSETRLHNKQGEPIHQSINTAAFAEYAVVDQSQLVPIPKEIPLDSASLLACGVITRAGSSDQYSQRGHRRKCGRYGHWWG